jgi:hypothetical protein
MNRVAVFVLSVVAANASLAGTPIDEAIAPEGADLIDISNAVGSVTVTGSDRRDVRIVGELSDDAERLDVRRDGDRIIVHVIMRDERRSDVEGTTLDIAAPREIALKVATVSASIVVEEVTGEQELATVSGSVQTALYEAEIRARTVSGRIQVEGSDSPARAEISSVSGRVDLDGVSGEVIAQSVSGSIDLESPLLVRGDTKSVSGNSGIRAALAADGRLRAISTSGRISLDMLGAGEGRYEISTFSGSIDNCFGPEPDRPQFGPPTSTLRFQEGDVAARVDVNSMSGNVELCRSR